MGLLRALPGVVACACAWLLGCGDAAPAFELSSTTAGTGGGAPLPDAGVPALPCPPGELPDVDGGCIRAGVPEGGCAEGFASDGTGGCIAVLPAQACAKGTLAIPGETRCRPVWPCGSGRWGDIPVEPSTQHVDGTYTGGANDGSASTPWTSIQAGIDAAAPGAIVAIAAGSYPEDLLIENKAVRLWGTCPDAVAITGANILYGVIDVRAGAEGSEIHALAVENGPVGVAIDGVEDVLVEGVWIHDTSNLGLMAQDLPNPTSAVVRASLVEGATTLGLFSYGSALTVEESVVRDTLPGQDGQWGRALSAWYDPDSLRRGSLTVRRSVVERNPEAGIYCGGCDASVEGSLVRAIEPRVLDQQMGVGIYVVSYIATAERGELVLVGSVVEQTHGVGVVVQDSDGSVTTTVVRDVSPRASDLLHGSGVGAEDYDPDPALRPALDVTSSLVERTHTQGIFGSGAEISVTSTIVRDVDEEVADDDFGYGVSTFTSPDTGQHSGLVLRGSVVERTSTSGVYVFEAPASIEQTAVHDVAMRSQDGTGGFGIVVIGSAAGDELQIAASAVERCHNAGMQLIGVDAAVGSTVVSDVAPGGDGRWGWGIQVRIGEHATEARIVQSLIEKTSEVGVWLGAATLSLDRVIIRDVERGFFGDSVLVDTGISGSTLLPSTLTVVGSWIDGSPRAGIANFGSDAYVRDSFLSCNTIDLVGEPVVGGSPTTMQRAASFEDQGGNRCGCAAEVHECKVLSANLEAPPPLEDEPTHP